MRVLVGVEGSTVDFPTVTVAVILLAMHAVIKTAIMQI